MPCMVLIPLICCLESQCSLLFYLSFFFLIIPRPPISTLFPYTTLFRSMPHGYTRSRAARTRAAAPSSHLAARVLDRKSTRLNSSHITISYAVFCLKKKNNGITGPDGPHNKGGNPLRNPPAVQGARLQQP